MPTPIEELEAFEDDLLRLIEIVQLINRPTAVFDPAPGGKVGRPGQSLRLVTSCENNLLYMLLHIRLRIRNWSNLSEYSFCIRLSALNYSANGFRTWTGSLDLAKCHEVKEAGNFFCLKARQHRNMFFCFPVAHQKSLSGSDETTLLLPVSSPVGPSRAPTYWEPTL